MSDAVAVGLLVHVAATLAMTGLIWFVQIVHYPLFARVGAISFADYEREHVRRTGRVVAAPMLLEAATAPLLLAHVPGPVWAARGSLVLLVLVWIVTATVQVPLHGLLEAGWQPDVGRRLVRTNWVRTLAWTGRSALMLVVLAANVRTA